MFESFWFSALKANSFRLRLVGKDSPNFLPHCLHIGGLWVPNVHLQNSTHVDQVIALAPLSQNFKYTLSLIDEVCSHSDHYHLVEPTYSLRTEQN